MLTIRRIYLYLVSGISLIAITWAIIGLIRLILSEGIGQGQITNLAWLLALIIVGLPIFLFHWLMAQRLAARSLDEQVSPIRQAYLYIIMAVGAVPIIANVYVLLDKILVTLLGGIIPTYYPYDLTVAEHVAAMVVWGVVWLYTWRLTRTLPEQPPQVLFINAGIERIYLLLFSLGGLVMITWGVLGLMQTIMEMLAGQIWRTPVANYSAQLLIGAAVWASHWLILQSNFAGGHPLEERSVLRKVYLYLAVFVYSLMALTGGALLLKRLIELALGAPPSGEPLLLQLSTVVPMMIAGVVFWAYHWNVLKHDARQAPEAPRQASVRRVYQYLVAGLGLSVTLIGIAGLLILLVDILTSPALVGMDYYRESVAAFVAMILVGTPVWWLPWRWVQNRAVSPVVKSGTSTAGAEERRSTVRKIYLYFFVFVASLVIFGSVGWFVYHILTALLGADLPDDFITLVLSALVVALLAVAVWLYHWWAIRQDGALAEEEQVDQFANLKVVVIDGNEGKLGQTILGKLANELPGIRLSPVGLTPQATTAMNGQPFSAALLESANYVVGSWQALTAEGVSAAVTAHAAPKLVVPASNGNWLWVGPKPQSADEYAEQVARGIKRAAEGESLSFTRDLDATTIVGIVIGVIVSLCIVGNLVGLVAGMM